MAKRLFSSESVTEGHPDKIADQISDSILDAMLADDPDSHVAVETLVTTGLVVVAGEVDTADLRRHPTASCGNRILEIGYDSSDKGFDGQSCGISVSLDQQSADIRQGVDDSWEERHEHSADPLDLQGAGDQGLMFGYRVHRHPGVDAAADRAGAPTEPASAGGAQAGGGSLPAPGRQSAGDDRVRRHPAPVAVNTVVVSTQHLDDIDLDTLLAPDIEEFVIAPGARGARPRHLGCPAAGEPDRTVRGRRAGGRRRA